MGGYPFSFEPHIQFLSFSNGKHTFVIIHCSQHTFPNVSRLLFFFFLNLQVSSVEIGLGLYLNIWPYRASVSLWINVLRSA